MGKVNPSGGADPKAVSARASKSLGPSDEVSTFTIVKRIKEIVSVMLPAINSLHEDWIMLCDRDCNAQSIVVLEHTCFC